MDIKELNKIIENKYGENAVFVHPDVYPEVEELYLISPVSFSKEEVADFYQKYDYQGIRNALDIARDIDNFKNRIVYEDNIIEITPSQKAYLEAIGWAVNKLKSKLKW